MTLTTKIVISIMKARFYEVPSFSDPDKKHTIRLLLPEGEWRCSCPHFVFKEPELRRKGLVMRCDHIRRHLHTRLKYHGRKRKK